MADQLEPLRQIGQILNDKDKAAGITTEQILQISKQAGETHYREYIDKGGHAEEYAQKEKSFLDELKNLQETQLKRLDELQQERQKAKADVTIEAGKQTEILKIEQDQKQLSDQAAAGRSYEIFPKKSGLDMGSLANLGDSLGLVNVEQQIDSTVNEQLSKNRQFLEKVGLSAPENEEILKTAIKELVKTFLVSDRDLEAVKNTLKTNLTSLLEGLNDIYEKGGGKGVFKNGLEMLINFSKYTQTGFIDENGRLNKDRLKDVLQYSRATYAFYLANYSKYLDLEKRKKTPSVGGSTGGAQMGLSEIGGATSTASSASPEKTPTAVQKEDSRAPIPPAEKPQSGAETPARLSLGAPTTKEPEVPPTAHTAAEPPQPPMAEAQSMFGGIKDALISFLKLLSGFFGVDLVAKLGLQEAKALAPEVAELMKNLNGFNEAEKSALTDMMSALFSIDTFKENPGKNNLSAKLKTLFGEPSQTRSVLGKKPPSKSWEDYFSSTLKPQAAADLASSKTLSADETAKLLT